VLIFNFPRPRLRLAEGGQISIFNEFSMTKFSKMPAKRAGIENWKLVLENLFRYA